MLKKSAQIYFYTEVIFQKRKHKYLKAFHDLAAGIIEPHLQIWTPCFVPCRKLIWQSNSHFLQILSTGHHYAYV